MDTFELTGAEYKVSLNTYHQGIEYIAKHK